MEQQVKRARLDEAVEAAPKPVADAAQANVQRYEKPTGPQAVGPSVQRPVSVQGEDVDDGAAVDGSALSNRAVRPPRVQTMAPQQDDQSVKALADFVVMMDNYTPIIPNSVTRYYLRRSGFTCQDDRVIKVISLAAQKFVADIANDSMQFCKIRQEKRGSRDNKYVMTMEDLTSALAEQGVQATKPHYFQGSA